MEARNDGPAHRLVNHQLWKILSGTPRHTARTGRRGPRQRVGSRVKFRRRARHDRTKTQARVDRSLHPERRRHDQSRQTRLRQFLDVNILELEETRRTDPLAIALSAVVLQPDRSLRSDAGELGVLDNRLPVQHDGNPVASARDHVPIPFSDGFVGLGAGRHRRANVRGLFRIVAISVKLARPDRSAPDIHLIFPRTAQQDS